MKRMDKYNDASEVPSRSEKNSELYKQIYNAYDEFENLVIPSNTREIDLSDLKREVTSRDEYRKVLEYGNITNNKVVRKEIIREEQKRENEIYDINELLDKAVAENKKEEIDAPSISSSDYLKKLKVDKYKTNLEKVKEVYSDIAAEDDDESLMHTANLSLEILSDLKGDNENTFVEPIEDLDTDDDFYSNKYKFSKKDFDNSYELGEIKEEIKKKKDSDNDEEDEDFEEDDDNSKSFLKIFFLIFGVLLVIAVIVYLFYYFGKI